MLRCYTPRDGLIHLSENGSVTLCSKPIYWHWREVDCIPSVLSAQRFGCATCVRMSPESRKRGKHE